MLLLCTVIDPSSTYNDYVLTGSQILVRALLRVASPSSVFTATPHLLSWTFAQPLLANIARALVNDSLVVTGGLGHPCMLIICTVLGVVAVSVCQ